MKLGHWKSILVSGAVGALCGVPSAQAGWVTVTDGGTPVLTACNPKPYTVPEPSTCLLTGNTLIAAIGPQAILVASRSAPIVAGGVTVGTLYDRIYCYGTGGVCATAGANANKYTLAMRVQVNANPWNGINSNGFEVNDIIRKIVNGRPADSAYWLGPPIANCGDTNSNDPDCALPNYMWLEYTGKTQYGWWDPSEGTRDNNYIDHRNQANMTDIDGITSRWSSWVVVKQTCLAGISTTPQNFKTQLWNAGEEWDGHYTLWMAGYACNPF